MKQERCHHFDTLTLKIFSFFFPGTKTRLNCDPISFPFVTNSRSKPPSAGDVCKWQVAQDDVFERWWGVCLSCQNISEPFGWTKTTNWPGGMVVLMWGFLAFAFPSPELKDVERYCTPPTMPSHPFRRLDTFENGTKLGMTKVVLRGSWGCHHCKQRGAHPETMPLRKFAQDPPLQNRTDRGTPYLWMSFLILSQCTNFVHTSFEQILVLLSVFASGSVFIK